MRAIKNSDGDVLINADLVAKFHIMKDDTSSNGYAIFADNEKLCCYSTREHAEKVFHDLTRFVSFSGNCGVFDPNHSDQ